MPDKKPRSKRRKPMQLDDDTASMATLLAMTVRNAMEDFHVEHLTDEQMAELNPIIRNAIATALYAIQHMDDDPRCESFVNYQSWLVPSYWERPELLPDLAELAEVPVVNWKARFSAEDR